MNADNYLPCTRVYRKKCVIRFALMVKIHHGCGSAVDEGGFRKQK